MIYFKTFIEIEQVGPRTRLDDMDRMKTLHSSSEPSTVSPQPVAIPTSLSRLLSSSYFKYNFDFKDFQVSFKSRGKTESFTTT
jgi:hypothetical protein